MAVGDDINRAREETQKLTQETGFLVDAFSSLGETITGAIEEAIVASKNLDTTTKKIADSYSRDIAKGIKGIVGGLDEQLAIQIKINKGQNATKEIEKAREKSATKLAAIQTRINILKNYEGELGEALTSELEEQEQALISQATINNKLLDSLQHQSDEAVRQKGIFSNLRDILSDNLDKIDKTGTLSKVVNFKKALADGDGLKLIMVAIVKGAMDASNAINDIQKSTGLAYGEAVKLQAEFALAATNSGKLYVNTLELNKAFGELTKQTGFIADFGGDTLETFVTLNKQLGLSAEAAGNLSLYARIQGEDTENILSNTVDTVNALNKQDKVAVNVKTVLSDIASVSKSIAGSLGFNPERLAGAAREARKLGLSLSEVDGIAESLLDFESSISAELEAELLTGKQLNFEKARSFALSNDLKGLSEEIGKNQAVISAFADEDRISQAAIAKSLGISRDQLAQMALSQQLGALGAEKFRDTYGDVAYQQLASLSASEKFQESLVKIQGVIGDIAIVFAPILDGFASLVGWLAESQAGAMLLAGAFATVAAVSLASAIANIYSSFAQIPLGLGIPLAIAASAAVVTAVVSAKSKNLEGNDIISPAPGGSGYGKRTLFGPEGAISLNDKDTIVAGTDLKMGDDIVSPPQMGITETITNNNNTETVTNNNNTESSSTSINISPLVEQMNKMNATLNAILGKEGTVTLDGTKVGTALTVGSYKLQ